MHKLFFIQNATGYGYTTPTATISGATTVCRDSGNRNITFTGAGGVQNYTFRYTINGGSEQTVTTSGSDSVTVAQSTMTAGTYTYALVSVTDGWGTTNSQTGTVDIKVLPLPSATISGTTTVAQNDPEPNVLFTGANATRPYTFTYYISIDGVPTGGNQTITTVLGSSINLPVSTGTIGVFTYTLIGVQESEGACLQAQTGSAIITVTA